MKERRQGKLSSLIRSETARFIEMHADLPLGTFLTVTRAEISSDGGYARVFVSLFPYERVGTVLKKLHALEKTCNAYLRQSLRMKRIPHVRFLLDEGEAKRAHVEELLEDQKK